MIKFREPPHVAWWIASISSAATFYILIIAFFAFWPSSYEDVVRYGPFTVIEFGVLSAAISFLIASIQSVVVARDRKILSLTLSWLLMAPYLLNLIAELMRIYTSV